MPTKKTTDNKETSNQKKTKSSAGGFAKGHKKVGGRKKGSPNKITADLRNMIKEQIAPWIARIGEDMKALEPAERLQAIAHLGNYVLPKYSNTTINADSKRDIGTEEYIQALNDKYDKKDIKIDIDKLTIVNNG